MAPSLDHVGCITRSAWDAAAVLQIIAGYDPLDPATETKEVPNYVEIIENGEEEDYMVLDSLEDS